MNTVRVELADDHPIVRKGIRGILERAMDIQVVGEATTGKEAIEMAKEILPDVLLLDMELPEMNGIEVARQLHLDASSVKILVLSAHDDPVYIHELMEMGISGYILKDEAAEFIVEAVRGVARGEQGWVSRGIASRMMTSLRGEEGGAVKFTPREMDVLRLVTEGKTNQNIAVLLRLSEKTVEKYMYSIFQKLGVTSRTEAAVYAVRENIV